MVIGDFMILYKLEQMIAWGVIFNGPRSYLKVYVYGVWCMVYSVWCMVYGLWVVIV